MWAARSSGDISLRRMLGDWSVMPFTSSRVHLLRVEVQVRLRDERVPVVADESGVLHDVRDVLAVVQGLPLALAGQPAHGGGRTALVLGPERDLVGPVAGLRAVRADLAVDLVDDDVLTDQRGDHAGPAAGRGLVVGAGLERDRLLAGLCPGVAGALPPLSALFGTTPGP